MQTQTRSRSSSKTTLPASLTGPLSDWQRAAAGDLDARDKLLAEHLNLVYHVARQLSRSLAAQADYDELVSSGTVGLMNAVEAFDFNRGLAFSTFAVPRIRGAILDELRREDHVPRSIRRKNREISTARESLMRTLGRSPDDTEMAAHLSIDLETFWRWRADIEGAVHVPLDRTTDDRDSTSPTPAEFLSSEDEGIDDLLSREQEVGLLRGALLKLKEQERTVLALYYFEELKMHEIAEFIGVTESRVSQIRTSALARLRATLSPAHVS